MVSGTSMTRIMEPIFFPSNLCGFGFSFKEFQGVADANAVLVGISFA
jgi:hypothetical protein